MIAIGKSYIGLSVKCYKDATAAKDVVQEIFTIFWIKISKVTINSPLAAFLYTLTRSKILDMVKHSNVENKYLESLKNFIQLSESLPDRLYVEKELHDQIWQEIKNLPEKMRIIFEMS